VKSQILHLLKQADGFLSGSELSRQLGVTRAAVWKVIKTLQQDGYPIEAVTNRGYRLAGSADILSADEIETSLAERGLQAFIRSVRFDKTVDSTNLLAKQAGETGSPEASLFVAERQLAGRGRRGRSWLSDHQQGLWFSILLRPAATPAELAKITLFAGLCVAQALNEELQADVGLKWPNDVVSRRNGRKLCGILTEMVIEENTVSSVIIGIGLNILTREFPDEIASLATSLSLETGRDFRRTEVLAAILSVMAKRYPAFLTGDDWLADYKRYCLTLGRAVQVIQANGSTMTGTAIDLDAAGELVILDSNDSRQTVLSGEVSVRGLLGNPL